MKAITMNDNSIGGGIFTVGLFIISKITASDWASVATILSSSVVIIVNLPKVIEVYRKYFNKKKHE